MSYSLNALYRELGTTKQAVHQSKRRQDLFDMELEELVKLADDLKKEHPGCGVAKMYKTLLPKTMGRDKFCEIFLDLGYGVKPVKNYRRTTIPTHIRYPNLIERMQVTRPGQVIQTDITYFDFKDKFYYMVFIIDVYTKEILGYKISNHMRTSANIEALQMALRKLNVKPGELIHHSDRGAQYASNEYTEILKQRGIHISMGLKATDNAFAERVNGTIKNEYMKLWTIDNEKQLKSCFNRAVKNYNTKRKHQWFDNRYTPTEFSQNLVNLNAHLRPKVIIYTEGDKKPQGASSSLRFCTTKEPKAHNCPMEVMNSN